MVQEIYSLLQGAPETDIITKSENFSGTLYSRVTMRNWKVVLLFSFGIFYQYEWIYLDLDIGVFHVVHVNRDVNIFLLNRKIFYVTKIC